METDKIKKEAKEFLKANYCADATISVISNKNAPLLKASDVMANFIAIHYPPQDFSKSCVCAKGESTGEMWCCNHCGLPTNIHTEPLSDREISIVCAKALTNNQKVFDSWFRERFMYRIHAPQVRCEVCEGHGELSKPPYDDSGICPNCNGSGQEPHTKEQPVTNERYELCPKCEGKGDYMVPLKNQKGMGIQFCDCKSHTTKQPIEEYLVFHSICEDWEQLSTPFKTYLEAENYINTVVNKSKYPHPVIFARISRK